MARKRSGLPLNGWIAIDKPQGLTSTTVVSRVRRITGAAKAGHGGTLDPMATGVLPIALGEATKTVAYVMDGAKSYTFRIRWGQATDTDDAEGQVIAESPVRADAAAIEAALVAFQGEITQVPPRYSAVKIAGQRAYALAREGEEVELKPRTVRIDHFRLTEMVDSDHADFAVQSGKGTYMRSLARDLAAALGTFGHLCRLRRTSCGPFHETAAISLDKLEQVVQGAASANYLLPVETALDDIPALALTEAEARRLQSGQPVSLLRLAGRAPLPQLTPDGPVRAMAEGRLVALARIEGGEVRPVRVLNL
jgi:tRNA pseudouridine55 synthase